jgi:hypothetical protein
VGNAIHQIRAHVLDMLGSTRRLLGPLSAQLRWPQVQASPEAGWLVSRICSVLTIHAGELAEHLQRLGGSSPEEPLASDAAGPAGLPLAKAMADDYSRLSLAQAAALMLETNARALGYSSTAALAARHREEIGTLLAQIREFVPLAA